MKSESNKLAVRGELALIAMVIMNSAGVLLMLHSGSGISAISSVPYGFQQVFPQLTLGTWTYMFQGLLVLVLMLLRRKFMALPNIPIMLALPLSANTFFQITPIGAAKFVTNEIMA